MSKVKNKKKQPVIKPEKRFSIKDLSLKTNLVDLLICLGIVSILFVPTLVRPWLLYDERILFEGLYHPTPSSITELFEVIGEFGLNSNVISSNSMYSSNYVVRSCPFNQLFWTTVNFLFQKKDPFLYHALNFVLHLINTTLIFFILKIILARGLQWLASSRLQRAFVIILTSLWAVHPVIVEPVLLSTNSMATFTYIFFFALFLDYLINKEKNTSTLRRLIIPALFIAAMLTNEYSITLPLILFTISFYNTYQVNPPILAFKKSLNETLPYFIGLFIYSIYFFLISDYQTSNLLLENNFTLTIQRIFWLTPQIFIHLLKLIFFPKILSIDQSLFVRLGKTLYDPYSISCIILLGSWLFIPLILFLFKKKLSNIFLLTWTFFFALMPFLHIFMPSYALAADRYLYAPLAMMIFGVATIISKRASVRIAPTVLLLFCIILTSCFIRSYYRASDWKDNYSFVNSTYKTATDPLFKAMKLGMLGKAIEMFEQDKEEKERKYFKKTLTLLQEARIKYEAQKEKYQENLPAIIKAYGLDYDSLLSKIVFLESSSRCLELGENFKVCLKILEPYVKNSIQAEPRILDLYTHLLILDKQYDKAKKILLEAHKNYPKLDFILRSLFDLVYKHEKDYQSAEKYILKAYEISPQNKDVLLKILNFYQLQNNLEKTAKYAYLFGLRTHSRDAYQVAFSKYLDLGQIKNAKKSMNKLLKLDPNNPETLFFVSKYYYRTNDIQKAVLNLEMAYEIIRDPESTSIMKFEIAFTLATLYLKLGNNNQATLIAQDAIKYVSKDTNELLKLAELYQTLGLKEYSNHCLNQIKSLGEGIKS